MHNQQYRIVTLIVNSPKYSNRKVTKKTVQLQSNHPIRGSAMESSHQVNNLVNIKSP